MRCTFDHLYLLSTAQSSPFCSSCYRLTSLFCSLLSH
nr:MAG TPA: Molybdenum Cofactor Synthesis C [Caudoviricetes sp.]